MGGGAKNNYAVIDDVDTDLLRYFIEFGSATIFSLCNLSVNTVPLLLSPSFLCSFHYYYYFNFSVYTFVCVVSFPYIEWNKNFAKKAKKKNLNRTVA